MLLVLFIKLVRNKGAPMISEGGAGTNEIEIL